MERESDTPEKTLGLHQLVSFLLFKKASCHQGLKVIGLVHELCNPKERLDIA